MTELSPPPIPPYRFTLFFGPETDQADPQIVYCVFNLKKRSWKGGIQVVVELNTEQLAQAKRLLDFEHWYADLLQRLPDSERAEYTPLGHDIFVQQLCQLKLQVAIERGIPPDTSRLGWQQFETELAESLKAQRETVKAQIARQLDLEH
ncbi:MAG: hypothetical protein D6704_03165 [Nitrospirae bacterium]|nr:MAG: hypothetical protein D6704_03165 [Nitrospirota bacterium]